RGAARLQAARRPKLSSPADIRPLRLLPAEPWQKRFAAHENDFADAFNGSGAKPRRRVFGPANLFAGLGSFGNSSPGASAALRSAQRAAKGTEGGFRDIFLQLERFECCTAGNSHSIRLSPSNARAHDRNSCWIPFGAADSCFVAGTQSALRAAGTRCIGLVQL